MSPAAAPRPTPLTLAQYTLKARESLRFDESPDSLQAIRFGYFGVTVRSAPTPDGHLDQPR